MKKTPVTSKIVKDFIESIFSEIIYKDEKIIQSYKDPSQISKEHEYLEIGLEFESALETFEHIKNIISSEIITEKALRDAYDSASDLRFEYLKEIYRKFMVNIFELCNIDIFVIADSSVVFYEYFLETYLLIKISRLIFNPHNVLEIEGCTYFEYENIYPALVCFIQVYYGNLPAESCKDY